MTAATGTQLGENACLGSVREHLPVLDTDRGKNLSAASRTVVSRTADFFAALPPKVLSQKVKKVWPVFKT
jgi:hypothetical protein